MKIYHIEKLGWIKRSSLSSQNQILVYKDYLLLHNRVSGYSQIKPLYKPKEILYKGLIPNQEELKRIMKLLNL